MGLQITKTNSQFGIDLDYWKIGQVRVSWHGKTCRVEMLGFVNKTQRDAGKTPVETVVVNFNDTAFTFVHTSGIIAQVYAKIKALSAWSGSVDVLE